MHIQVKVGAIQEQEADAIIVNLFEGAAPGGAAHAVDQATNGAITDLVEGGDFKGKAGQVAVLYPRALIPARRVVIAGLGKQEDFSIEAVRCAAATAIRKARELGAKTVATILQGAGAAGLTVEAAAQAIAEGSLLGLYNWRGLKTDEDETGAIEMLSIVVFKNDQLEAAQAGAAVGQAIAEGAILTRDLVNNPPNVATPSHLAGAAAQIAERFGMRLQVMEREEFEALGMGAFAGVAKGTHEPPKFIILEHNPDPAAETIVLVGKGITFDSGGIDLKPGPGMEAMKSDMGGGGAVLGAMHTVGMLNLPLHVVGLVPATENMPGGSAYKPADVVKALNGKTIEIINTDAEGRMLLADALSYANRYTPAAVIDLATLTGASVVALGKGMAAAIFCEDEQLRTQLLAAAEQTHERLWHMPLYPEYKEALKSDTADIKNTSGGRADGVGTSAMFLRQFAEGYPWAHLDIAGVALSDKDKPYTPQGATGYGVRLLVQFLRSRTPGA
ncbi:MAG: leucyl aminopeptidase [Anaerolineae bacterium]|nr:leucyl aminopeptidase [Anaerolineae bacterium]